MSEPVPLTCQLFDTMHRSAVFQVNSICVSPVSVLLKPLSQDELAYVHVALMAHVGHVMVHAAVVHVSVIHMVVIHDFCDFWY